MGGTSHCDQARRNSPRHSGSQPWSGCPMRRLPSLDTPRTRRCPPGSRTTLVNRGIHRALMLPLQTEHWQDMPRTSRCESLLCCCHRRGDLGLSRSPRVDRSNPANKSSFQSSSCPWETTQMVDTVHNLLLRLDYRQFRSCTSNRRS